MTIDKVLLGKILAFSETGYTQVEISEKRACLKAPFLAVSKSIGNMAPSHTVGAMVVLPLFPT
jgi:hypothetical protein